MINKDNKRENRRPNAWKKYGAIAMAGVLLMGASAVSGRSFASGTVLAEENENRVTLNMADDEEETDASEEAADASEDEADASEEDTEAPEETEKRVTLNSAEKTDESSDENQEEEASEDTEEDESSDSETDAEIAPIESSGSVTDGIVTTDVSAVVENCMPSIVAITGISIEEIETYYYGTQTYEAQSAASGIIVAQNEEELLVATNSHVVEDLNEINVVFSVAAEDSDDLVASAKIKGMDKDNELAVIAIQLSDIPESVREQLRIAKLGSSDDLKVGQAAIAIGNALGYGQTVTSGIISALEREITIENFSKAVIVTDAAINFGNSGGALLNAQGEVIGINVAKEAGQSSESMGYSIPIDTAVPILEELINRQTRDKMSNSERGYLGATVVNVSDDAMNLYDMPQGAFVYEVAEDSAAQKAGLKKGDIITKFDGITVSTKEELIENMSYYEVGETVTIEVQSATDGEYTAKEIEVTLQKASSDVIADQEDTSSANPEETPEENSQDGQDDGSGADEENPFDGGFYDYGEDSEGNEEWAVPFGDQLIPFGNGSGF